MKIRNVTEKEIRAAVHAVAGIYSWNVQALEVVAVSAAARKGMRGTFRVRLGVKSSRHPGARRSHSGRRIAAACWHAFGHFFDALPQGALIDGNVGEKARESGAPWVDRQIGPQCAPVMMSETCDCAEDGHAERRLSPAKSGAGPAWLREAVPPVSVRS